MCFIHCIQSVPLRVKPDYPVKKFRLPYGMASCRQINSARSGAVSRVFRSDRDDSSKRLRKHAAHRRKRACRRSDTGRVPAVERRGLQPLVRLPPDTSLTAKPSSENLFSYDRLDRIRSRISRLVLFFSKYLKKKAWAG